MKVVVMEYSSMVLSLVTLFGAIGIINHLFLGETGIWARLVFAVVRGV